MRVTWLLVIRQTLTGQTLQASLIALVGKFSCYTRVLDTSHVNSLKNLMISNQTTQRNSPLHPILNKTVHRHIHKTRLLNQILTQDDSVNILILFFRKIHFHITLPFTPWSIKWPLPLSFSSKVLVRFPTCFMPVTFKSYLNLLLKPILLLSLHSESL